MDLLQSKQVMKHPLGSLPANVSRLFGTATVALFLAASLFGKGYYPPRISFIDGKASYEPAGDVDWTEVTINLPLLSGDRIVSQPDSRVEVELGEGNFLRLGGNTDIVFGNVSGSNGDIEMQLGELVLRVNDSARYFVHLPGASVKIKKKGYYRFSVNEQADSRVVVWKGQAEVENAVGETRIKGGEQLILASTNTPLQKALLAPDRDDLGLWSDRRDAHFASSQSVAKLGGASYVGVYDLDDHGAWDYVPSHGNVWFPSVSVGWAPYRAGRWSHYPTWGWTWVSHEPWGWLPYHHGRWYYYQPYNRWCWAPGSFSYWSPARVHFYWGSGYVGWSPYGFGFGSGGGYYGGGGYINNSVTIVNNKTIVNHYRDPGYGLTVVTEDDFRASRVDRARVKSIDRQLVDNLRAGLPRRLASGTSHSRPRNTVVAGKNRGVDTTRAQRGVTGSFSRSRTSTLARRPASSSKARSGDPSVTRSPLGARKLTSTGRGSSSSRVTTRSARTRTTGREETGLPVAMAEDPLSSVVFGAGKMLSDFNLLRKISID